MKPILAGIETEYGFLVEGHGPEELVDDATAFVKSHPGPCWSGWDYRFESSRRDLRGFVLDKLSADPTDAQWDVGRVQVNDKELRADRVLTNGARFYNDHGHPEYSTPECWSLRELVLHDLAGEEVVWKAGRALARSLDRQVQVFKNNTDYHGASYGTHEAYLVPRKLGFDGVYAAVLPMLVVRQVLCGAGKTGAETGSWCDFQMSQRADFMVEAANAETLFRRPIFNTRDEPHADPLQWMRLHVICGDASLIPSCTARKVGLVKLALHLALAGVAPVWKLLRPVQAFQDISRGLSLDTRVDLEGGSWTSPRAILESYFDAAAAELCLGKGERSLKETICDSSSCNEADEMATVVNDGRDLLAAFESDRTEFNRHVDWAAKHAMLSSFAESESLTWRDPIMQSLDLAYHDLDPEAGLYHGLAEQDSVEPRPLDISDRMQNVFEGTRARVRGLAVKSFGEHLTHVSWGSIGINVDGQEVTVPLDPDRDYPASLADETQLDEFLRKIQKES